MGGTRSIVGSCGLAWGAVATVAGVMLLSGSGGWAHTRWADGTTVPAWVRNACCGPSDIHHLLPSQVHRRPDGLAVDGLRAIVPYAKVLPSMDGDYWVFFRNFDDGTQYVFCLFAPPDGS